MQKLNYQTMKDNILKELDDPQEKRRDINITIDDYFERHQATKKIKLTTRVKKYGLVFDKWVIDRSSRVSTPDGYSWYGNEVALLREHLHAFLKPSRFSLVNCNESDVT